MSQIKMTMEPPTSFTLVTLLLLILNSPLGVLSGADQYSRSDFPADFVFGSGTSAYQYSVTPWYLQQELDKFKLLYGNPPLFILENGQRTAGNSSLLDLSRVKYFHGYIGAVLDALRNGSNVKGYFAWSFMDVFELLDGYSASYGLYYVDRNDPELKRYPKLSAKWYKWFLMGRTSSIELVENEKDPSLVSNLGPLFE